jgi:hypothetical protein
MAGACSDFQRTAIAPQNPIKRDTRFISAVWGENLSGGLTFKIASLSLAGFITAALEVGGCGFIEHGLIFMDVLWWALPGAACQDDRLSQGELALAGRASLIIEAIQFFKIDDGF